jgi:hypothetical protein
MMPSPLHLLAPKPWHKERARLIFGCCTGILAAVTHDVGMMKAVKQAIAKFNKSALARRRGMRCSSSTMRAYYARFKAAPSPATFEPQWGKVDRSIIGSAAARELALRAIERRVTATEFHRRMKEAVSILPFSRATLMRALPVKALRQVYLAQRSLEKAERAALRVLDQGGLRA